MEFCFPFDDAFSTADHVSGSYGSHTIDVMWIRSRLRLRLSCGSVSWIRIHVAQDDVEYHVMDFLSELSLPLSALRDPIWTSEDTVTWRY